MATGNDTPDPNKPKKAPDDNKDPAPEIERFAPKGKRG